METRTTEVILDHQTRAIVTEPLEVVRTHSIAKILREADAKPTIAEKVAYLQRYGSNQLQEIVRHTFEPTIKYAVTITPVPRDKNDHDRKTDPKLYRPQEDDGSNEGLFYYEIRKRLIYLIEGGPGDVMSQERRDLLFHNIIESINPEDAELLLTIKDKQWPYATLTPTVLNEAFPNLISVEASVANVNANVANLAPKKALVAAKQAAAKKKAKKKATPKKKA